MPLPLRLRAFWSVYRLIDRHPVMQQPPDKIRAAAKRRERDAKLPGAALLIGRTDPDAVAETRTMTTPEGVDLPVRIHRPRLGSTDPRAVIVNFHGGGWVSGDARQSEWWCSTLAARAGVVVVSVDYRLAPEHPFPAAPEDCYAALEWTVKHSAELGIDASRVAVMGDSAGGNLAAVVSLMSRDRGGPALALQILLYPAVDFVDTYASEEENAHAPVLGKRDVDTVPDLYFHGTDADRGQPYASPLRATDHRGLPAALIQTAQFDPLRDQGGAYERALRAAGVPVRLTNYVDAAHGFISLPGVMPAARQALGEAVGAVRDALRPDQPGPTVVAPPPAG